MASRPSLPLAFALSLGVTLVACSPKESTGGDAGCPDTFVTPTREQFQGPNPCGAPNIEPLSDEVRATIPGPVEKATGGAVSPGVYDGIASYGYPRAATVQATLVVLEDGSFRLSANECSGSTQGFGPFTPTCWTTFASGYLETSGVEFFFHYRCLNGKTSEREDWSWYTVRACGRDGYPYPGEFLWVDLDGTPVTYRRR